MYLKGWSILQNIDISLHRVEWLSLTIHLPEHPCLQPYFRSSRQAFHALGARSREVSRCYPSHTYKPHPSGEGTIWTDGRLVYQIVLWYIDLKTCCSKDSYNAHCASPLSGMVDSFKLFPCTYPKQRVHVCGLLKVFDKKWKKDVISILSKRWNRCDW